MNRMMRAGIAGALICGLGLGSAMAATMDRKLSVKMTLDGKQDWKNELQWSKASTQQSYEFTTTLQSDGKLEGANLLDPDKDLRMAIKTEYLRRKGAALLKAQGFDPSSANLMGDLSRRAQQDNFNCKGESVCLSDVGAKYASLMAAAVEPDNSAIFEGEPRYLFFFAAPNCVNTIRSVVKTQTNGETGYGRKKDKIFPYALDVAGDYSGSETDKKSLCTYYTVVVDTKDNKMFVENVYVPSSRGKITRTEFGKTQTTEADLVTAAPLQEWVNTVLRHAPLTGTSNTVLPLTMPLDGNSTVMGNFTGEGKATLKWSWTEVGAAVK